MPADSPPPLSCPHCSELMKVVRAIPGMGAFPPLLVYRCAGCNHVETKEQERR